MHASVSKPIAGQVILYQAPEILAPIIIPLIGFLLHAVGNFKASRCVQVLSCMGAIVEYSVGCAGWGSCVFGALLSRDLHAWAAKEDTMHWENGIFSVCCVTFLESSNQGLYIHVTSMRDLHHGFCWPFVLAGHLAIYIYRIHGQ